MANSAGVVGADAIEDSYGHRKRLNWIRARLNPGDVVVEIGCGTGFMVTLPLLESGYDVTGLDLDEASIKEGRRIFSSLGADPDRLVAKEFCATTIEPDVVIVSEVLEHLSSREITKLLGTVRFRIKPGGRLLLTVPNGYGWFELESFLWSRAGLARAFRFLRIQRLIDVCKERFLADPFRYSHPSTLSNAGHVQRFTFASIQRLLETNGFRVKEAVGTVIFAGPISNLLFRGFRRLLSLNAVCGTHFPRVAAGFLITAEARH